VEVARKEFDKNIKVLDSAHYFNILLLHPVVELEAGKGDFIPMKDFALVGMGDRTNRTGVEQMLRSGLGFDEAGVVHQPNRPLVPGDKGDPMIDMHLDTYFNVASSGVVVGSELLLKAAKVEVYRRQGQSVYKKEKEEPNLHDFIRAKGFDIINITTLEQMSYASNFVCIRDGTILARAKP
jgi:arginine deiminase